MQSELVDTGLHTYGAPPPPPTAAAAPDAPAAPPPAAAIGRSLLPLPSSWALTRARFAAFKDKWLGAAPAAAFSSSRTS